MINTNCVSHFSIIKVIEKHNLCSVSCVIYSLSLEKVESSYTSRYLGLLLFLDVYFSLFLKVQ